MSTVDRSAQIRAALKAKGWTSRDVSVKSHIYSMGSSIRISIKNPKVPKSVVKAIAEEHESIDRDQFGEILSGGNRFVFVDYGSEAEKAFEAQWLPAVKAAIAAREGHSDNSLIPVEGSAFSIGVGTHGHGLSVWSQTGHVAEVGSYPEAAARVIGAGMVEANTAKIGQAAWLKGFRR